MSCSPDLFAGGTQRAWWNQRELCGWRGRAQESQRDEPRLGRPQTILKCFEKWLVKACGLCRRPAPGC